MAQIKRFSVGGGEGNDVIAVYQTRRRGGVRILGLDTIPSWIEGGAGNDRIGGGGTSDTILGGGGHDVLAGGSGPDVLAGGTGNDRLQGDAGEDLLEAGAGHDRLHGGTEADVFLGGAGTDTADYSDQSGDLSISLNDVADDGFYYVKPTLPGTSCLGYCPTTVSEGDNVTTDVENVISGSGDDAFSGSAAANVFHGGPGDDALGGHGGADSLYGGDGRDEVFFSDRNEDLHLSLDGVANDGAAGEAGYLESDIETIHGGPYSDRITGNDSRNVIYGDTGNDTILGAGGNDEVFGGGGWDYIEGGKGHDRLLGHAGRDQEQEGMWQDDTLYGNDGNDYLHDFGHDTDLLSGGDGTDTAFGNPDDVLESIEGGLLWG